MRNALMCGTMLLCLGCGSATPTVESTPANPIRASTLVETYRDFPDRATRLYTNQIVAARVLKGHYLVVDREIRWYVTGDRTGLPAAVFACRGNPVELVDDLDVDLLVTGKCIGRVWDSGDRGDGVKFTILVTNCVPTTIRSR